jgi:hypothetical protein
MSAMGGKRKVLVDWKCEPDIIAIMRKRTNYRGHTPNRLKILGLFRLTFCVVGACFLTSRVIRAFRVGEVEAPLRAMHLTIINESSVWFAVALAVYSCMAALFGLGALFFGKQVIEDFRT